MTLHHIPILTTVLSAIFCGVLVRAYMIRRSGPHLLWWALGIGCYGAGTLVESLITVLGNSAELTKAWYITGALLGGYPLAQGTVYLLYKRRFANISSFVTVSFIVIASLLVIASPVRHELIEATRPSGKILAWSWVRLLAPFINLYAVVFLIGGAIVSAIRAKRQQASHSRFVGNVLIALGAILPGIGGSFAVAGKVEVLYVTEFLGLILIWCGYGTISRRVADQGSQPRAEAVVAEESGALVGSASASR